MTRDQIISQLFSGKSFNDCIAKMEPTHLQDDLKMEVMTVICELSEDALFDLYDREKLEHYTTRVIINMIINKYSPFFKKYRSQPVQYMENLHEPDTSEREETDNRLVLGAMARQNSALLTTDEQEIAERQEREKAEDYAMANVDSLYWYDAELLKLYVKHGNYRAIEKETGIPFGSCYKNIQKSIQELKQRTLCSTMI